MEANYGIILKIIINININNIIDKVANIIYDKNKNINNNLKKEDDEIIFDPEFNKKDSITSKRSYNIYNKSNNNATRNKSFKNQKLKKK